MEGRLYEAAMEGSVAFLLQLLQEDRLILDRVIVNCYSETPLHIAAMLGHVRFTKEILARKPELATELDCQRRAPLHLASAKGCPEIVRELVAISPEMCLVRDGSGRSPLHLAAMKGRSEVLKALVDAKPTAALIRTLQGETVLHVCARRDQFEGLKTVAEALNDKELVNAKDDDGNTVLHLAAAGRQIEMINYLLTSNCGVEVNALNSEMLTPMDILARTSRNAKDLTVEKALRSGGGTLTTGIKPADDRVKPFSESSRRQFHTSIVKSPNGGETKKEGWISRKRDSLMVVSTLIATMTFQAGVNPPRGTWQDSNHGHKAGTSIMAVENEEYYPRFLAYNTTGFVSSLSVILMLVAGTPFHHKVFLWALTVVMVAALISIASAYAIAITVLTPERSEVKATEIIRYGLVPWTLAFWFLLLGHTVRLLAIMASKIAGFLRRGRRPQNSDAV